MKRSANISICDWKSSFLFGVTCFPELLASGEDDTGFAELLSGSGRDGREEGANKKSK